MEAIKKYKKVFGFLIILIVFGCKEDGGRNKQNDNIIMPKEKIDTTKKYKNLIDIFESQEFDFPEDLWTYKNFIYFYENSDYYLDEAIRILNNEKTNSTQRKVVIYNMQRLSLENYMKLYETVHNLYEEKKIDKETFLIIIYPTFGRQNTIINNYKDDLVKKNIKNLLLDNTLNEYHDNFKEILSGKTKREQNDFFDK